MITLRILSLNIRACVGNDLRLDTDRVGQLVQDSRADLVGLQEVDRRTGRSEGVDQAARIAEMAGLQDFFIPSFAFSGGLFGNAILTRFEIDRFATLRYKTHTHEPRSAGAIRTRITPDGPWLWFATTHLGLDSAVGEQLDQARELANWLEELTKGESFVLTGDLNETPDQDAPRWLAALWTDVWTLLGAGPGCTWSSAEPQKRIDYIFHAHTPDGAIPHPTAISLLDTDATDHRGVLATYAFD